MQISNTKFAAAQILDGWCGTKPRPLPQPEPKSSFNKIFDLLKRIGLNPQPLPPKELDGWCGTVPKRFPVPPPPGPEPLAVMDSLSFALKLR